MLVKINVYCLKYNKEEGESMLSEREFQPKKRKSAERNQHIL
jgi:hypothetical protein